LTQQTRIVGAIRVFASEHGIFREFGDLPFGESRSGMVSRPWIETHGRDARATMNSALRDCRFLF